MSLLATGLTGLSHATLVFLVAAALTLVLDATRLLDLGQAALAGLAAALAPRLPLDPVLTLVALPVALAALGAALDLTLYRRLSREPLTSQLIAALGLFLLLHDAAGMLRASPAPPWPRPDVTIGALHLSVATLVLLAIGPAIFGLLRGIPVRRRRLLVPIATALSGLAGTLALLTQPAAPAGFDLELLTDACLAVVLGGLGSLGGAFLGAVVVALAHTFTADLFPGAALAITGAVLLLRPQGFLGHARPAPAQPAPSLVIRPAPGSARLLFAAGLLLALATPFIAPGALPLLVGAALAILFGASLHLLIGPGGMPSLGHAAFFGIGAAAAALFVQSTDATLPMLAAALLVGAAAAGLAALPLGFVLARLSAQAVAMLTLVVAQLVWTIVARPGFLPAIGPSSWPATLGFWLILAICLGVALLLRRVIFAPFGYALRAARDDPARAAANGLPVTALRLAAIVVAGVTAGLAGALTVIATGTAAFTPLLDRSADALLMLATGGVQAIAAPIVGALAYSGASALLPASSSWPLLLGSALVAVPLLLPDGIAGVSIRAWRRAR